jgi:hypothetical protein
MHEIVDAEQGKLSKNVREGSGRSHGGEGLGGLSRLEKTSCCLLATRGETFHVLHHKFGPKASLASKEEVFLEGPRDGVGPSHLAAGPAVRDGVVRVTARDLATAIDAGGAMKIGMEDVEARVSFVLEERGEQRALEAVGVNAESNDGLGGLMEAKNECVLGTKAAAASFSFVVAVKTEGSLEGNAPAN